MDFLKKKIKTVNNKMAIITNLLTIESKETHEAKKNRDRITDTETVLMVAMWERDVEEWVRR